MNSLISVVIPIYNVEDYLCECLDSVLAQTYKNLEILLVDDGSTDGSATIAKQYETKETRIRLIHQENRGLSGARNTGINLATGDYLIFVDSDDSISSTHIEILYQALKKTDADVANCLYTREKEKLETNSKPAYQLITGTYMEKIKQLAQSNHPFKFAWGRLIARKVFEKVSFIEGMILEDGPFFYETIDQVDRYVLVDSKSYFYRNRKNSILNAPVSQKHFDQFKKNAILEQYFKKHHPEAVNYIYDRSFVGNEQLAKMYIHEHTIISKKLLEKIYEENKKYSQLLNKRKLIYHSQSTFFIYLKVLNIARQLKAI